VIVSVRSATTPESQHPLLRLVFLPDASANTYTADCSAGDPYLKPSAARLDVKADFCAIGAATASFAAAWGANSRELVFLPSCELQVSTSARQENRVFVMRGGGGAVTDELVPVAAAVIPGLYGYALASTSLSAALRPSKEAITVGDQLQRSCELPMDG
jgi:hypothetical protein